MGGGGEAEAPKTNYRKDINSFVSGLKGSFPDVLSLENRYRNDFTGLNLGDASNMLFGAKGEMGTLALSRKLGLGTGNILERLRGQELSDMTRQSGATRKFLQSVSPESASMVRMATQDAKQAQMRAQGLTGQEERAARQFAREGAASRGRLMDNSGIAAEILNRDNILAQKRAEAAGLTQNAYNMANSFYSAPGLQALSGIPNAYRLGMSQLGIGLGGIGSAKPQLVDIGAGLNLGAANRQNQFAANAANAQMDAQKQASYVGAGASAGATIGTAIYPGIGTAIGALVGAGAGYAAS